MGRQGRKLYINYFIQVKSCKKMFLIDESVHSTNCMIILNFGESGSKNCIFSKIFKIGLILLKVRNT